MKSLFKEFKELALKAETTDETFSFGFNLSDTEKIKKRNKKKKSKKKQSESNSLENRIINTETTQILSDCIINENSLPSVIESLIPTQILSESTPTISTLVVSNNLDNLTHNSNQSTSAGIQLSESGLLNTKPPKKNKTFDDTMLNSTLPEPASKTHEDLITADKSECNSAESISSITQLTKSQKKNLKKNATKKKLANVAEGTAKEQQSLPDSSKRTDSAKDTVKLLKKDNNMSPKRLSSTLHETAKGNNIGSSNHNKHDPHTPHFRSHRDPELDEQSKLLYKYGQGRNLVAIGPKKVRDPQWALLPPPGFEGLPINSNITFSRNFIVDKNSEIKATMISNEESKSHNSPFSFSFGGL